MTTQPNAHTDPKLNMELWEKLRRVDPEHTKQFQRAGGFKGTAIKPAVQEQLMTEVFGPIGFGWGMTKPEYHHITAGDEMLVYCTVGVWYRFNGEKSDVFWGEGGDKVSTVRKSGDISVDDEARKKSLTDAIGNALKRIGMAADIHMGLWDDSKYRDENEKFFAEKKRPDELRPAAIKKSEDDLAKELEKITDLKALDDLWASGTNARIKEIGTINNDARQRMISAFTARKNELLALQNDKKEEPSEDGQEHEQDQTTIQEEADRDQAEHMQQVERQEAAATLDKPAQPAKAAQDELTPEKILAFKEWVDRKLPTMKDTVSLNTFWDSTCAERMIKIRSLNQKVHKEISDAYINRQNELSAHSKGSPGFKRVINQE